MKPMLAAALGAILLSNVFDALAGAGTGTGSATPAARSTGCSNCGVVESVRRMKLDSGARWVDAAAQASGAAAPSAQATKDPVARDGKSTPKATPPAPSARSGTGEANQAARDGEVGPRRSTVYEVVIRMDDGKPRKLHYEHRPALAVGDRVRVSRGQVYLR